MSEVWPAPPAMPMPFPATVGAALQWARRQIDAVDAKVLLRAAAGVSAATLAGFPERALSVDAARCFADWVSRRAAGEPVAYLLGVREFRGREFRVGPATLIPRPETELLVDLALERLRGMTQPHILDLGTGSGAIAVTLALECPQAQVTAVDASAEALAVAADNATRLGAAVRCLHGSWFVPVAGQRFDLIVANPPYVAADDPHLALGDLRFEPRAALAAGPDGLDDIRWIIAQAPAHLSSGGWLLLEHGYDQAESVRALLYAAGFPGAASWRDLAGIERASGARCP